MFKAISYIRFSSLVQGKGSSVERQERLFEEWLADHPEYAVSDLKAIDRGVSAYSGKHRQGGLGGLLRAIEDGLIGRGDAIVIEAIDRLTREDAATALSCVTSIVNAGVKIYTVEDQSCYDTASLQSAALHVLVAKIHASYEYSNRLSKRLKASYSAKLKKAKEGEYVNAPNRPFWIDAKGFIKAKEALIVKKAIELYRSGLGQLSILKAIQEEFCSNDLKELEGTASEANVKASGMQTIRSVKRLLTNEALIGEWRGVKSFEALISVEEYLELIQLVEQRTKFNKPEEKYLLSGILVCKHCGSAYNFRRQKARSTVSAPEGSIEYKKKGDIVYANCSSFLKSTRCNNSFTVPYEVAELVFNRNSDDVVYALASVKASNALSNRELAEMRARLKTTENSIERMRKLYEVLGDDADLDRLKHLKDEKKAIERSIEMHNNRLNKTDLRYLHSSDSVAVFEDGTVEQKNFSDAVQLSINSLTASTLNFRNALKDYGYQIIAGRPDDKASTGVLTITGNEYSIIKRSQKNKCYFVAAVEYDDDGNRIDIMLEAKRREVKLA